MNYTFPEITHIDNVIPHIEDRPEFKVMDKGWYTVINYMVAFEDTFSLIRHRTHYNMWMRRECRGLIFDNATGQLISRPYHKFFNVGEREETQIDKLNLSASHIVLEKLDGSMIRPIPTPEGFRLGTKAGITDVAMNAEVFIGDKPHYGTFIKKCIQKGTTPIFEWCSRKNRIVVDYPKDNLILTGIRYNDTGKYVQYQTMNTYATAWNIPVVKAIAGDETDLTKIVDHIRKWDDGEGVVIRFDDGHMVKVKADDYVLRHKSKEQINQEKNVLQVILDDSVDDVVPLLTPDDATRLKAFQNAFWLAVDDLASEMADMYNAGCLMYPDRKDFATQFVQTKILPIHAPIMYAMKGGKGSRQTIVDMISKSLTTQTKIDQNRWLFGGLSWNV